MISKNKLSSAEHAEIMKFNYTILNTYQVIQKNGEQIRFLSFQGQ